MDTAVETRTGRAKRWTVAAADPRADALAAALKVSPLVAQILLNRGIDTAAAGADFLRPTLKLLHNPSTLAGLDAASDRIARAIKAGEKIVVYGDYDVDGITAVSILWHAVRALGGQVQYYIPHRVDEGYGLNAEAVAEICAAGATLIVTVDCGVTAVAPARVAVDRNVDLIITDHHEFGHDAAGNPVLPACTAVVHPKLPGPDGAAYANPHLCGAGVAFKLAWGIGKAVVGADKVGDAYRAFLVDATALAALGTIADVVPLVGENRALAAFGLKGLEASKLTGIRALIASAALTGQPLDAFHVGFRLGPRLNACGRMGHAKMAVEMLTEATPDRATEIAVFLESQNRERQSVEKEILEAATRQASLLGCDKDCCRAVVVGGKGWHPGVIGIVASRLVERFGRPAVVVALHDGVGQGSGRSIGGFHLADALAACTVHLQTHGGHEMAAGLRMDPANLLPFREAFQRYAFENLSVDQLLPEVKLEATTELRQITPALVADLARLGPFGMGNRKPLLACHRVQVARPPRRVGGGGQHVQLAVRQGSAVVGCILFNAEADVDALRVGDEIDVAGEAQLNQFNGNTAVQLRLADWRPSGPE